MPIQRKKPTDQPRANLAGKYLYATPSHGAVYRTGPKPKKGFKNLENIKRFMAPYPGMKARYDAYKGTANDRELLAAGHATYRLGEAPRRRFGETPPTSPVTPELPLVKYEYDKWEPIKQEEEEEEEPTPTEEPPEAGPSRIADTSPASTSRRLSMRDVVDNGDAVVRIVNTVRQGVNTLIHHNPGAIANRFQSYFRNVLPKVSNLVANNELELEQALYVLLGDTADNIIPIIRTHNDARVWLRRTISDYVGKPISKAAGKYVIKPAIKYAGNAALNYISDQAATYFSPNAEVFTVVAPSELEPGPSRTAIDLPTRTETDFEVSQYGPDTLYMNPSEYRNFLVEQRSTDSQPIFGPQAAFSTLGIFMNYLIATAPEAPPPAVMNLVYQAAPFMLGMRSTGAGRFNLRNVVRQATYVNGGYGRSR